MIAWFASAQPTEAFASKCPYEQAAELVLHLASPV